MRQKEFATTDRFGEPVVIHRKPGGGLAIRHTRTTPTLALSRVISGEVGARIRAIRESKGWTLEQLATRAGLATVSPKSRMWEIENAQRQTGTKLGTLYAIAIALNVDICALVPPVSVVSGVVSERTRRVTELAVAE